MLERVRWAAADIAAEIVVWVVFAIVLTVGIALATVIAAGLIVAGAGSLLVQLVRAVSRRLARQARPAATRELGGGEPRA